MAISTSEWAFTHPGAQEFGAGLASMCRADAIRLLPACAAPSNGETPPPHLFEPAHNGPSIPREARLSPLRQAGKAQAGDDKVDVFGRG
jgi:hypothetical protein